MGKSKRLRLPNRKDSESKNHQNQSTNEKCRSLLTLISPDDITEETLLIWQSLPPKIRQDPTLEPFRLQNERLFGSTSGNNTCAHDANIDRESDTDEDCESTSGVIEITANNGTDFEHIAESDTEKKESLLKQSIINMSNSSGKISHSSNSFKDENTNPWQKHSKVIFLFLTWFFSMAFMTTEAPKNIHQKLLSIDGNETKTYYLPAKYYGEQISLTLEGPFLEDVASSKHQLIVTLHSGSLLKEPKSGIEWKLPIPDHKRVDYMPLITKTHKLNIDHNVFVQQKDLRITFRKDSLEGFTINVKYDPTPVDYHVGAICAGFVLIMFYVLLICEIVNRAFAAMLSSTVAIALLSVLDDRPSMSDIVQWMNSETLLLLFSMMILVGFLNETGVFNYIAVYAFKKSNGRVWPLIFSLCLITAVVSAFLHNVTTILMMTPITITLCECCGLNPIPILLAVILNGNIGATATPLGHVPNLLITGNSVFARHGVTFISYTIHMTIGTVLAFIQTCIFFRWIYFDAHELRMKDPKEMTDLRREITVWERTANSLSTLSKESQIVRDTLFKKVAILNAKLNKIESKIVVPSKTYRETVCSLQKKFPIKNQKLLIKCSVVMVFIISMFFIQSMPTFGKLSIGWSALIGVMFLFIITDSDNMDAILHRLEWSTLIFFGATFVMLGCLERLRLVEFFSDQAINIVTASDNGTVQLASAILILLWLSGLLSSIIDSIPVTAMMIKVVTRIAENENINLPIQPLVWAVAFGPCLGGNGTLYGALANILCAGIAEKHGYKLSFSTYFRKCFPIMIGSLMTISGYLLVAHILFDWHSA